MEDDKKNYKININLSPPQVPTPSINLLDKEIFKSNKKLKTIDFFVKPKNDESTMSAKEKEIDTLLTEKIQKGAKFKEVWDDVIEPNLLKMNLKDEFVLKDETTKNEDECNTNL